MVPSFVVGVGGGGRSPYLGGFLIMGFEGVDSVNWWSIRSGCH